MNEYEKNVYTNLFEYPTKHIVKLELENEEKDKEIERSNNIIKSLFDYCKEQQEKSFDSVAEECYAEVMYFISERLEKIKELKESEK